MNFQKIKSSERFLKQYSRYTDYTFMITRMWTVPLSTVWLEFNAFSESVL